MRTTCRFFTLMHKKQSAKNAYRSVRSTNVTFRIVRLATRASLTPNMLLAVGTVAATFPGFSASFATLARTSMS